MESRQTKVVIYFLRTSLSLSMPTSMYLCTSYQGTKDALHLFVSYRAVLSRP